MSFLTAGEIASLTSTLAGVSNARLIEIQDTPALASNLDPTGPGTVLWSGSAPGYLDREESTAMLGGPMSRNAAFVSGIETAVNVDTFTILDTAGAPLLERPGPEWEGTTVTIEDQRTTPATTWAWRVKTLRHDAFGTLDSVTMELEQPVRVS